MSSGSHEQSHDLRTQVFPVRPCPITRAGQRSVPDRPFGLTTPRRLMTQPKTSNSTGMKGKGKGKGNGRATASGASEPTEGPSVKTFLGPGMAGTRLAFRGHDTISSKGGITLANVLEHTFFGLDVLKALAPHTIVTIDMGKCVRWICLSFCDLMTCSPAGIKDVMYMMVTTFMVEGDKKVVPLSFPLQVSGGLKNDMTGQNRRCREANGAFFDDAMMQEHVRLLSECTGCTLDPAEYLKQYWSTFERSGTQIQTRNKSTEGLRWRKQRFRAAKHFASYVVNVILAADDAVHVQSIVDVRITERKIEIGDPAWKLTDEDLRRFKEEAIIWLKDHPLMPAPIVVIGNLTFGVQRRGQMTAAAPKVLLDILKRHFSVIIVNEKMSSQVNIHSRVGFNAFMTTGRLRFRLARTASATSSKSAHTTCATRDA